MCKPITLRTAIWLALVGYALTALAAYPGFMSWDSNAQYAISISWQFNDWQPPVMSWLWTGLNVFFDGPEGMLFYHLALLWGGLFVWYRNYQDKPWSWIFIAIGFAPWVANFSGVLWKDVGMAFSLLCAMALLANKHVSWLKAAAVVLLIQYAFMVRANSLFAALPVLWFAIVTWSPNKKFYQRIGLLILTLLLMWGVKNLFTYDLLSAERKHPDSYVMYDDLVYLSISQNDSLLPRVEYSEILECSRTMVGETVLVGRLFCLEEKSSFKQANLSYQEIKDSWVASVSRHPLLYLGFRVKAFGYLLRSPFLSPYYIWNEQKGKSASLLAQENNVLTQGLKNFVWVSSLLLPFIFKPYGWLLVLLGLLVWIKFLNKSESSTSVARTLSVSGLLYLLSYFPITPMADFRYAYWSVLSASVALAIVIIHSSENGGQIIFKKVAARFRAKS